MDYINLFVVCSILKLFFENKSKRNYALAKNICLNEVDDMIEKIKEHIKNNRDIIFDTGASLVSILFSENPVAQSAPAVASVFSVAGKRKLRS